MKTNNEKYCEDKSPHHLIFQRRCPLDRNDGVNV